MKVYAKVVLKKNAPEKMVDRLLEYFKGMGAEPKRQKRFISLHKNPEHLFESLLVLFNSETGQYREIASSFFADLLPQERPGIEMQMVPIEMHPSLSESPRV